ncbi:25264_t:CDS:2 [Dentiscutata erythropus]|uniref:25264_t:CDS:1 n=1 Tax=Dentiscutata erythropus TaxID=1348616 RepID=A0A9N9GF32_9GLOM|nr:25264_t:CDS:2 [Dentiscutata erythropus]
MTTRSRTLLFLQYRNSFARSSHSRPSTTSLNYLSGERDGLLVSDHVIELSVLPPNWVDIVEEVDDDISQIKSLIPTLESLHRKHALPGFDDRTEEEREIERLSSEITKLFQQCQQKIRRIADESRIAASNQETTMSKNIQISLATKLQDLSTNFRKQQSAYMKRVKVRSTGFFPIENNESDEEQGFGFTNEQLALTESSEAVISQREHEINEIAKSIQTIAEIFNELQALVIDQGTLLDRIDYNVEQMVVNVKGATRELDRGANYQKKSRNRKIILLLLLIIFGLIIILIFKPRKN